MGRPFEPRRKLSALTLLLSVALCGVMAVFGPGQVTAARGFYIPGSIGIDVSWPKSNCRAAVPKQVAFAVIGVTGGKNFTRNDCLFSEAASLPHMVLYMNTGYPGTAYVRKFVSTPLYCMRSDGLCLAYNYGFHAAEYALFYADSQNVHSTIWWLDVETENSWSDNVGWNQASIQGAIDAIVQYTLLPTVGIYSTPTQWQLITGGWKIKLPNWVGTGSHQRSDAIAACHGYNFTGGGTVLAQYILKLDHDYVC